MEFMVADQKANKYQCVANLSLMLIPLGFWLSLGQITDLLFNWNNILTGFKYKSVAKQKIHIAVIEYDLPGFSHPHWTGIKWTKTRWQMVRPELDTNGCFSMNLCQKAMPEEAFIQQKKYWYATWLIKDSL